MNFSLFGSPKVVLPTRTCRPAPLTVDANDNPVTTGTGVDGGSGGGGWFDGGGGWFDGGGGVFGGAGSCYAAGGGGASNYSALTNAGGMAAMCAYPGAPQASAAAYIFPAATGGSATGSSTGKGGDGLVVIEFVAV